MSTKHRPIMFVVGAFVLFLGAAPARASTLTLGAVACVDGSCLTGTPAASGGDVIPGATGIGVGVVRHQTEPGVDFDAFMNAIGAENYGVFRAGASASVSGEANSASPGEGYGAAVTGTDVEEWTITGGTGTAYLDLAWTISGSGSRPAAELGGTASAFLSILASANGESQGTGDVTTSGVYAGLGSLIPFQFDVPFTITFNNEVSAGFTVTDASLGLNGSASAGFTDTSTLTGATITDALGNPITGATILSDAGIEFPLTPPVETATPEPSSLTLVILAIAAAGLVQRWRRRAAAKAH
ncbi:MAG TPA: PEP-CTERM sorting domain-containing protein [Bryobacteraceae bacterium]|nr:PEP-CTERM sorting domain-containing protein [Bryobacteraceae bacterium]